MKILLMGNAGAGKTTLGRALRQGRDWPLLSLDQVAFAEGAERRPLSESVAAALSLVQGHEGWIIEGCYADILEALLPHGDTLIFLNPGVATCVAHCRQRPWEPDKYATAEAQDANLEMLLDWVGQYASRADEYGLAAHRRLYAAYAGRKFEFTRPTPDMAARVLGATAAT